MCDAKERKTLISRYTECTKFLGRVCEVVSAREEALDKLSVFHQSAQALHATLERLEEKVKGAVMSSEELIKWQKESQELDRLKMECSRLGIGLDPILQQAQLTTLDGALARQRTTVKGYLNRLLARCDMIQSEVAIKQEHFDEVDSIWQGFLDRKEKLLKAVEDLEERAEIDIGIDIISHDKLQEFIKLYDRLKEELEQKKYELTGLQSKGKHLSEVDPSQESIAKEHLKLVEMTWEDTKGLIDERHSQLTKLATLLRDYQQTDAEVQRILAHSENLASAAEAPRHFSAEEVKRHLTKLEALKKELDEKQPLMDELTYKGKLVAAEAKKQLVSDATYINTHLEEMVDRYLDVGDKTEEVLESLKRQLALWNELAHADEYLEEWFNSSINDLNASVSSLEDSVGLQGKLKEVHGEIEKHQKNYEELQKKVQEMHTMRRRSLVGEMDELAQVNDNMKGKLERATAAYKQAQLKLEDFTTQKSMLLKYVMELQDWLDHKAQALNAMQRSPKPEHLKKSRDIHAELLSQRDNVESTKEHLNNLCRKYQTSELTSVQDKVSNLATKYDEIFKLATKVVDNLESSLDDDLINSVKDFYSWFRSAKEVLGACSDTSGDVPALEEKMEKLQNFVAKIDDGQNRVDQAIAAGEACSSAQLPRASGDAVEQQLQGIKDDWHMFLDQLQNLRSNLEESLAVLRSLEDNRKELARSLKVIERSLQEEEEPRDTLDEKTKQHETLKNINAELSSKGNQVETLLQQAYDVMDGDSSQSGSARKAHQLISMYHGLCKKAKERLRTCEQNMNDHQQFDEAMARSKAWMQNALNKLEDCMNASMQAADQSDLEHRLQDIHVLHSSKQEGEIKMNIALGKGERAAHSSTIEGRDVIHGSLRELKETYEELSDKLQECRSQLEQQVANWSQYTQSYDELDLWLCENDALFKGRLVLAADLKDKEAQLGKYKLIEEDVASHTEALDVLRNRATQLNCKGEFQAIETRYNEVKEQAMDRVSYLQRCVEEHISYHDAFRDFTDWLNSAKEELDRWSDAGGKDKVALQKKLLKVQSLKASRTYGRQKFDAALEIGDHVVQDTADSGKDIIKTEIESLKEEWRTWDRNLIETEISLQSQLSQVTQYEESFGIEREALTNELKTFQSRLNEMDIEQFTDSLDRETLDSETAGNATSMLKKCQNTSKTLSNLQESVDTLKARLNTMCRTYQGEDIDRLSKEVTAALQRYDNLRLKVDKCRITYERALNETFQNAVRDFDAWVKSKKDAVHKYGEVSGDRDVVQERLRHLQALLSGVEEGQSKLNSVVSISECLLTVLGSESSSVVRQQTKQCRDAWKTFLSLIQDREQGLRSYVEQLNDFDSNVIDITEWLKNIEERFEAESGLKATIGLKKSQNNAFQAMAEEIADQQYKYERMKRKAQKLGSSLELSRLNQLLTRYHAITKQVQEALKRSEQHLVDHQSYQIAHTECHEWLNDFGHRMETYSNLAGGKAMLDQRLGKLTHLIASRQDGEIKLNVMLGRGEKILPTTSSKGKHAIESQMKNLQETWDKHIAQAEQLRTKLQSCIVLWEEYDEAVKSAQTWLEQIGRSINAEREARLNQINSSESTFSDLEKCRALYRDVKQRSSLMEKAQQSASKIVEATGDAGGTRVDAAELREMYQDVLNAAQELLDEVESRAESTKNYHEALHIFTDWFAGKPVELFKLSDQTGGKEVLADNLMTLQALESELPEGEEKLKQAFNAGKKNSSDNTVKIQLQNLKEEWNSYRTSLTESLRNTQIFLEETEKYDKLCNEFQDWIKAMELCPDNKIQLTSDLQENKEATDRFKRYADEVIDNRSKLEKLTRAAQHLLESCVSTDGSMSKQVAQLSSRYQSLLMKTKDQLRNYQVVVQLQTEYQEQSDVFDEWLTGATDRFTLCTLPENVQLENTEDCCDKLEELLVEFESKKSSLSHISDRASKLMHSIDEKHQPNLRDQVTTQHDSFQDLYTKIQASQRSLRRTLHYQKDYSGALEALREWLRNAQAKVEGKPDIKYELFEKKAQLARYVGYQEDVTKHREALQDVGSKSSKLPQHALDPRDIEQVREKFFHVTTLCQQRIDELKARVKSHQDYHDSLQSSEKWLLGKSSQIMMASSQDFGAFEPESSSAVEDQLMEYLGVQEEISNFRKEVEHAASMAKKLLDEYDEELIEPLETIVQSQINSLQMTYETVQNAACQLVQRLTEFVHRHQDISVKLGQLGDWLVERKSAMRVANAYPAVSLYEASQRVKDIAMLIEDVKGKSIFLEECSPHNEQARQVLTQFVSFQDELQDLLDCTKDTESKWHETIKMQNEFKEWISSTEKALRGLEELPAEATTAAAKDHSNKCKKIFDEVCDKKGVIALLDDKYHQLFGDRTDHSDTDFHDLISQWERLYSLANNLNQSQERNLNATKDFSHYLTEVEKLTQHFQSQFDTLVRNHSESTTTRLETAKALVSEMQLSKTVLDELGRQLENLTPRMSARDAEMVEEKVRRLNQRWIEVEQKIQSRAQLLEGADYELREYRRQLDAIRSWLRAVLDKVADPVPMTLSVEDLNSARQQHSVLCKELGQKKDDFNELSSCHQTLPLSLSAAERDALHNDITDIQALFRRAQASANDKTNALNQAIGKRKDLWATSQQTLAWLEHIKNCLDKKQTNPLHPDAVAKLIQEHRALRKEVQRHKATVDEVVATGIQIIYEGKPESVSVRGLEDSYAAVDEAWRRRLDLLQQLLAHRELFHADVERCLRWLKEADIVTFPEVNLASSLPDLENHLGRYQAIIKESIKYQDLVSKICEKSQEIVSELSDVDQKLLTDKMTSIKEQFDHVCKAAEEKSSRMLEMMKSRKEYTQALEELEEYLGVGQTMLKELDQMTTGHTAGQARTLLNKARKIELALNDRKPSLAKIEKMRDCLKSSGQPWQPEELLKATAIYHRMAHQCVQRIEHFTEMAACRERFERRMLELSEQIQDCDRELNTGSPSRVEYKLTMSQQMAAMLTSCQIELRSVSGLAEQLCADMDVQDKALIRGKVDNLRNALHRIQGSLGDRQRDLEKRLISRRDFQGDLEKGVHWLSETHSALQCLIPLKLDPQSVQEEIKKLQITKEEVDSRIRVLSAMGDKEIQHHLEEGEELPTSVSHKLVQLDQLKISLASAIEAKQAHLEEALGARQRYTDCLATVQSKLGSASAELQLLEADSNPEHARDLLEQHQANYIIHQYEALFTTEGEILHYVDELEEVAHDLDLMSGQTGLTKTARDTLNNTVGGVRERAENLLDSARDIHDSLQAAAISWEGFDIELERATSRLGRCEERLKNVDCSVPSSLEQAQRNVEGFQLISSDTASIEKSIQALQEVSQTLATSESVGGRMAVGRSLTAIKHRFNRLQARSKEMERMLEKHLREWEAYQDATTSTLNMLEKVQGRLPNAALERCTAQELTQQRSLLHSLSNQVSGASRRLSTVQDTAQTLTSRLDSPVKHNIEDNAEKIKQRCQTLSEITEEKLDAIKAEIQTRETLNAELRDMLIWLQDTRENADRTLDITPAPGHVQDKIDTLRQLKEQLSNKEAHFNKISEEQRQKYLSKYAILPVELSSTIAKIRIALAALHQELRSKEEELESARNLREDYQEELMHISSLLTRVELSLSDEPHDLDSSQEMQKDIYADLDQCHVRLVNLDAVAQEIADQTSHDGSKASLKAAIDAVNEHYIRLQELADAKAQQANQAAVYLDELEEMGEFLKDWKSKASGATSGPLIVTDSKDARRQMREQKNLRDQLKRLTDEVKRKEDRLPSSLPLASSTIFHKKVDEILNDCQQVEKQIRRREEELAKMVAVATDMEEEVKNIYEAVNELKENPPAEVNLLDDINAKRRLLDKLGLWRNKLNNVKDGHPYCTSPNPSPRKRFEYDPDDLPKDVDVPKLPLHTLREPVLAVKMADETELLIDEVEIAATADLLRLEAMARDQDAYEDEIIRLTACLEDSRRRMQMLPSTGLKGSPRRLDPREELEEYRKILDEVKGYEKQIDELKLQASKLKGTTSLGSISSEGSTSPSEQLEPYDYTVLDKAKTTPQPISPATKTSESSPKSSAGKKITSFADVVDETIKAAASSRQFDSHFPDFDDIMLAATADVPISPVRDSYRKSPSPKSRANWLKLADFLGNDLVEEDDMMRKSADSSLLFDRSLSDISQCSTSSLLSPSLAKDLVLSSPETAASKSTDHQKANEEIGVHILSTTPRPLATSSPFMVTKGRPSEGDFADESFGVLNRSWQSLKDQLGERAKSLLTTLQDQDDLQIEIQAVTGKLDEFQHRLDKSDTESDLQKTLQLTQELLDDINRVIPQLEAIERRVRFLSGNHTGRDAFNAAVSVLYDRWDTIRMQATSKQNTVEIKILEEEQYRRMVEAYRAELQVVTEWVSETRKDRPLSAVSSVSSSDAIYQQLNKCRNTVSDIERKLKLLAELSGNSSNLPGSSDVDLLLHELECVKDDLEDLQKDAKNEEKRLQDALQTRYDENVPASYQSEFAKMHDWLQAAKPTPLETPTLLQRQLSEDLKDHQEHMEMVSRRGGLPGRSRSASKDSHRSLPDADQSWKELHEELDVKPEYLKPEQAVLAMATACDYGDRISTHILKDKLQDVEKLWKSLRTTSQNAAEISNKSQQTFKDLANWVDGIQFDMLLSDWTIESDVSLQDNVKEIQQSLLTLHVASRELGSGNVLSRNERHIAGSLRCLDERMRELLDEIRKNEREKRNKREGWRDIQVELKVLISQVNCLSKDVDKTIEQPSLDGGSTRRNNLQALLTKLEDFKKSYKSLNEKAHQFATGAHPCHTMDTHQLCALISDVTGRLNDAVAGAHKHIYDNVIFDQALSDYGELLDAATVRFSKCTADNIDDLKDSFSSHQELVRTMQYQRSLCKAINDGRQHNKLDSLLLKHKEVETSFAKKSYDLSKALQSWVSLQNKVTTVSKNLDKTDRLLDENVKVEAAELALQDLQADINDLKTAGRELAEKIICLRMENNINDCNERWLTYSSKVNQIMFKRNTINDVIPRFEKLSSELDANLKTSAQSLSDFLTSSSSNGLTASKSREERVASVLEKVERAVLSFDEIASLASSLEQIHPVDETMTKLRDSLDSVTSSMVVVSDKIVSAQKEVYEPHQLLDQLLTWIRTINQKLDDEKLASYDRIGAENLKRQITLYRTLDKTIQAKRNILQYLESILEYSSLQDLTEKWNALEKRTATTMNDCSEEYRHWFNHQNQVHSLQTWLDRQIKTKENTISKEPGTTSQVKAALKENQKFGEKLKSKYFLINELEKEYKNLVMNKNARFRSASPEPGCGSADLGKLHQSWALLEHYVTSKTKNLQSALQLWKRYQSAENLAMEHLDKAEYALINDSALKGDLKARIRRMENTQSDLEEQNLQIQLLAVEADCVIAQCSDDVTAVVKENIADMDRRWKQIYAEIGERLNDLRNKSTLMQKYNDLYQIVKSQAATVKSQCNELKNKQPVMREPRASLLKCESLSKQCSSLKDQVKILEDITCTMEESSVDISAGMNFSTSRLLGQVSELSRDVLVTLNKTRDLSSQFDQYHDRSRYLEAWLSEAEGALRSNQPKLKRDIESAMDELRAKLQAFKAYSTTVDDLNQLAFNLPISDVYVRNLQTMNNRWKDLLKETAKKFGSLQSSLLLHLNFSDACESWMLFITQAQRWLLAPVAGSYDDLLEQARSYDLFIIESGACQQMLRSIIREGEKLLSDGEIEDSKEFTKKIANLSKQWKSVLAQARQRKDVVCQSLALWSEYNKERRGLVESIHVIDSELEKYDEKPDIIAAVKADTEILHNLTESENCANDRCTDMLDAGHQVLAVARGDAHGRVKKEISALHTDWIEKHQHIKRLTRKLDEVARKWDDRGNRLNILIESVQDSRKTTSGRNPEAHETLHGDMIKFREREIMLEMSLEKFRYIERDVNDLADRLSRGDATSLRGRVAVVFSILKAMHADTVQQKHVIESRLSDWNDFDTAYRQVCDWMAGLEEKVSQTNEMSAEDLLETLQKDCPNSVDGSGDRRVMLNQLANKLAPSRGDEIERKLSKINDRWQYLEGLVRARAKKMKETIRAVQQLDTSMVDLRNWLNQVEINLFNTVPYQDATDDDIKERIREQRALQQDIEKHSTGVASVLNLCEVLLHDGDACPSEKDQKSIEEATKSLERRWKNICALSMDRRLKIEDTQRLWQKFIADFSRFSDWLIKCETTAKSPNTGHVTYQDAREELKLYETFQRQVHEGLTQLELINKQYRKLARESRTDASNKLKQMVHDGNTRWDALSRRVSCILRRLKHAIERREMFEAQRESLLVWLTETDLQLTNIEHFSPRADHSEKLVQIKTFQAKIEDHIPVLQDLDDRCQILIGKSNELDCVEVEEELEEFHIYCTQVIERLDRFHRRMLRLLNEENVSRDHSLFDDSEMQNFSWWTVRCMDGSSSSSRNSPTNLLVTPTSRSVEERKKSGGSRNGRITPLSNGSLEWDTYDISQSELETKVANGEISDDESIPEFSPLETRDDMMTSLEKFVFKPNVRSPTYTKRSNQLDIADLEPEISPTAAAKKRRRERSPQKNQQRSQLQSDIDGVMKWVNSMTSPPSLTSDLSIEDLEAEIKQLKETQKEIESRKPVVLSINLVSSRERKANDVTNVENEMSSSLEQMNEKWQTLNKRTTERKEKLQRAMVTSKDFRETLHTIRQWTETQSRRTLDDSSLKGDLSALRKIHKELAQLRIETLEARVKVASLQDMSNQLLFVDGRFRVTSSPPVEGAADISEKLNELSNRLRVLLDRVTDELRLAEVALKKERNRIRSEASSDADSVAGDLNTTSSLKLKKLQRKVVVSKEESFKETRKIQISATKSGIAADQCKSNTSTGKIMTSQKDTLLPPVAVISKHSQDSCICEQTITFSSADKKLTQCVHFDPDPVALSSDSDVESGYVEYDADEEVRALRHSFESSRKDCVSFNQSVSEKVKIEEIFESDLNADVLTRSRTTTLMWRAFKFSVLFYFVTLLLFFPYFLQTCEDLNPCLRQNNLHYSLYPVLTYGNGPPPT
ncbi:unnamed protein product [Clavelina lepadiformis]|uniref:KASH domain-containing protein n=1 Tax=Clavelina lepadiformis TaxID=159417 RepID=A0ABP0FQ30_CLALP